MTTKNMRVTEELCIMGYRKTPINRFPQCNTQDMFKSMSHLLQPRESAMKMTKIFPLTIHKKGHLCI